MTELDGDALCVSYKNPARGEDAVIALRIPRGFICGDCRIKAGAGKVKIEAAEFLCKTAEFAIAAGKLKVSGMTAEGKLAVETAAGEAKMERMDAGDVSLEVGAGKCAYSGSVRRNLSVECGVGRVTAALTGRETDYNYKISCAMGSVTVNGRKMGGFAAEKEISNPNAAGDVRLECGAGHIVLDTEE